MKQQDIQLLIKDLCARLPYGVICHTEKGDGYLGSIDQTIFGTEYGINISPLKRDYFNDRETDEQAVKPYLRPMSSMTEEEENEYRAINCYEGLFPRNEEALDYVLEHHLDFRGLIEKGLALEAPTDMYKTE